MLHALIMAGGGGTRFWPRSRQRRPKQFLALGRERTLPPPAGDRIEAQVPAEQMAQEHPDALVTFGVPPTFPATGYGYIHRGPEKAQRQGVAVYQVQGFREKPDRDLAERYVHSGEYFWNSGIFVWKAATILKALRQRQPKLFAAVQRIAEAWDGPGRDAVLRREYEGLERISIDY